MLSRSFFPNFGQGPFPKIAGKGPGRKYWLTACSSLPRKKCGLVKDHPAMTIAVYLGRKATKQTNQAKLGTKT